MNYNKWKGRPYAELKELYPEDYEVESVEGSSMLIPMAVIEKYGFMHADFFMYGEDIDLSYKLQKIIDNVDLKKISNNFYLQFSIVSPNAPNW